MKRNIVFLIFVLGFLAAEAQAQATPEPKDSSEEGEDDDDPQALKDLVENLKKTFDEMIKIAKKDNPEIGAAVEAKLNARKAAAEKILADSLKESAGSGAGSSGGKRKKKNHNHRSRGPKNGEGERGQKKRPKRAAPSALDQIGQLLVESYEDTKADVAKLSPDAKCAYYNAYKTGVMKCTADPCVNKQKRLSRVCGDDE